MMLSCLSETKPLGLSCIFLLISNILKLFLIGDVGIHTKAPFIHACVITEFINVNMLFLASHILNAWVIVVTHSFFLRLESFEFSLDF